MSAPAPPPRARAAEAVVIGVSAGALEALGVTLPMLPGDYGLPVMIVVHVPPERRSVLAEIFAARCALAVHEAQDKEPIAPGIYFAPPDYHLLVETGRSLSLSSDEPVHYSRPAVDVLFESAADAYGAALVGVVLTGANQDGADGLHAVMAAGGQGLVQRPAGAYAAAMPEAAIARCPHAHVMSLHEIGTWLAMLGRKERS